MNWELDSILEQSISQIAEGKARVESCLLAYPAQADELGPLLQASEELWAVPKPVISPAARARIESQLFEAAVASGLVRRERKPLVLPRLLPQIVLPRWRWAYSARGGGRHRRVADDDHLCGRRERAARLSVLSGQAGHRRSLVVGGAGTGRARAPSTLCPASPGRVQGAGRAGSIRRNGPGCHGRPRRCRAGRHRGIASGHRPRVAGPGSRSSR